VISGILAFLGLIAVLQIARGAANLGIDFAGGTAVQLKFEQAMKIDEARRALENNGLGSAELQEFTQDNKLLIRVKASTTIEEKVAERVMAVFSKEFPRQQVCGRFQHGNRSDDREETPGRCHDCGPDFVRRDRALYCGPV
jgi:preprotein translocase subunit SecF